MKNFLSFIVVLVFVFFAIVGIGKCVSSSDDDNVSSEPLTELAVDTTAVDFESIETPVSQVGAEGKSRESSEWDVFNDAEVGERSNIAGINFKILFENQYCLNLSSARKLTKKEVLKVCAAKPGKDIQFYVDGKNSSLADCYASRIGGVVDYR